VISVGAGDRIAAALEELGELLDRPLITAERIAVCKRDGTPLGQPPQVPEADSSGLPLWQKLMIYTGEQARYRGMPLAPELMRRLRLEGATGATALRGIWGYHGDHAPHGDSPRQWRRRVPVTTIVIDRPPRIARWFDVVDELTADTGLVTSEMVPTAFRPI
jgi:PII-like signaling protein